MAMMRAKKSSGIADRAGLIPARVWEKTVPTADDRELMRTAVRLLGHRPGGAADDRTGRR